MSGRERVRGVLDALMAVLLIGQMERQFLPGWVHEVSGALLAAAVVAHVCANRRWLAGLRRGRWTPARVSAACVDVVLAATFVAMVASGLGMSGAAVGMGLARGTMRLRSVHLALVHVGLLAAGVHAGMHALPLVRRMARAASGRLGRGAGLALPLTAGAALVACGAHAFVRLDFASYISLRVRFALIDPSQSVVLFVLANMAVFVGCAAVGCLLAALCVHARRRAAEGTPLG